MASQKRKPMTLVWILAAVFSLAMVGGGVVFLKMLIKDDAGKRQRRIQSIQLVKPPPPPKIEEKPPEPEIKKEEIIEPEPQEETPPEEMADNSDEPPPGEQLGLDAEGTAGGDGFGLKANKGGRSLIGGGGAGSLLQRYAWYTGIVQEEIKRELKRLLAEKGEDVDGETGVLVRIVLDERGRIDEFQLIGSSGNSRMDDAVEEALRITRISEPPPAGMPKTMKIRITSRV